MKRAKQPSQRSRLMSQLRNMYELERAGDKPGARAAFQRLPAECRGVLCLVMFYGRCGR